MRTIKEKLLRTLGIILVSIFGIIILGLIYSNCIDFDFMYNFMNELCCWVENTIIILFAIFLTSLLSVGLFLINEY
jgi:hypothetical protein